MLEVDEGQLKVRYDLLRPISQNLTVRARAFNPDLLDHSRVVSSTRFDRTS